MVPSRLAFLQEFERDLDSICLRHWFETARKREPALDEFIDPATLRGFLQTEERDPRKPQPPDVAHDSVLPWRSVIVMIVLLKEACTCAIASTSGGCSRSSWASCCAALI